MNYTQQPKGWSRLIRNLRDDLEKIAPGLHVTNISVSDMGKFQFYYSDKGLTPRQQVAVDARVKKAEEAAWQTCVVCGMLGKPAWTTPPPVARVFCAKHKPETWNSIE